MNVEQKVEALQALSAEYEDCDRCSLACPTGRSRRNVVFADGNINAGLMIIGEAPGEQEDLKGVPFVGPSGDLFEKFLRSFSSDRDEVFITNIVCCRPTDPENPGKNRKPSKEEIETCKERLHRTIEIVDPYVILVLGSTAMKAVSSHKGGITAIAKDPDYPCASSTVRGQCKEVERPTIATFHPSYLLRNDSMEEGSDMYHAYYAWKKAFDLADMYSHIYTGETTPQRGEDA